MDVSRPERIDHLDDAPVRFIQPSGLVPSPTWLANPDPDMYTSWNEFAKQLWWDYQLGEGKLFRSAPPATPTTSWPGSMSYEPWLVNVEMGADGRRGDNIGSIDPGRDLLHIRYKSTTSSARGVLQALLDCSPVADDQPPPCCSATRREWSSPVVSRTT